MAVDAGRPAGARLALLVGVFAILALGGRAMATHWALLSSRVDALGAWGPLLFVAGFALAGIAFIPAGLLTLTAGALFGLWYGIVYAFAGATLGACGAFLLARYVARDLVERRIATHPRIAAISTGVSEHGRKIVFLLRLSPVIPFSVINYSMGITRLPFRDFVIASLGMLPVTAMFVYYGTVAGTIAAAAQGHVTRGREYYVLLACGLIATVIATTIVTRVASHALAREADAAT